MPVIGIFGGTFDPVHVGHLRPLLEVQQALDFDRLYLIPCGQPAHRQAPVANSEQRVAMLELALGPLSGFQLDLREIERDGPSYMVDTLRSLRDEFPQDSLVLILGMDAFAGLASWHEWQDVLELAHIVVCHRPQSELPVSGELKPILDTCLTADAGQLQQQQQGLIYVQEVTALSVSATQVRDLCRQGKSIHYLVPDSVEHYIKDKGLYL